MNRVCLIGRLTRKPELRENEGGTKQTNFSLAINRIKEGVDFINCVAWNKTAELIEKYMDKGRELGVEGRIQTNNYEDKDGNKRYSTNVVVDTITFIGNKTEETESVKDVATDTAPSNNDVNEIIWEDEDMPF